MCDKQFLQIEILLGHGPRVHEAVSQGSPLQTHPPLAGEVQVLVLDFDPVPHVTLQEVKSPHADQEPSTAIGYGDKSFLSIKLE